MPCELSQALELRLHYPPGVESSRALFLRGSRGRGRWDSQSQTEQRHAAPSFLPQTLESVDVHCFGHLLYEMTYGRPPDAVPVDSFPPAPSMAVGQYGVGRGLLGPGRLQSYSPPF